jgi:phosphoribosyl-ATP pyrophosphohydrolase/phosphoribosyl-AMP cyclohydrolase
MIEINWEKRWGLIPTIIQDYKTLEVLTLAYSNKESFEKLKESMETYLYSTSRNKIWKKWETSWNTQKVLEIIKDCDNDAILIKVKKNWPACHLGNESCFFSRDTLKCVSTEKSNIFQKLENIISERLEKWDKNSYTVSLKWKNWNKVLEKIIEEAWELIISLKDKNKKEIIWEFCDLLFHSLVALNMQNIKLSDIEKELKNRFDKNWILEKKLRNKSIVIIDYWSWNIRSVENCLDRLWVKFKTSSSKDDIDYSDLVIFPWVWNAKYAIEQLKRLNLIDVIKNYKKPFLWICLWMQLLFEKSEEWNVETLWIIEWEVKKFNSEKIAIPHMGFNNLKSENKYFYFIHSYFCPIWKYTTWITNYIEDFSSTVQKNNFFWCQFHPEKSWDEWEKFMKEFLINNL